MKQKLRLLLMQFLKESADTQQRYLPNKIGSDSYRAAMLACCDNYAAQIQELFEESVVEQSSAELIASARKLIASIDKSHDQ